MKRQKQVFKSDEVPHLWAHQTQESARDAGHRIWFTGDTIFSYGTHFPIARHVEYQGRRCVFFNPEGWSVTTSRHQRMVRQAIPPGIRVFSANPYHDPRKALDALKQAIQFCRQGFKVSKPIVQRENLAAALLDAISAANEFAEFFGWKTRYTPADVAHLETLAAAKRQRQAGRNARSAERTRIRSERWERELAETRAQRLEEWRAGGRPYDDFHRLPVTCRIVGETVETSYAARFPVSHALRAVPFVRRILDAGEAYQRNGHSIHLGHYVIDSINENGTLHAGCHHVSRAELERLIGEIQKLQISLDVIST
jgi:hypothetical protein